MSEMQETPATRILVAIDTSARGAAALEAAARLATELRAELQGLFVEDVNLLRLAGLPFTKEIDSSSGKIRPLDPAEMEQTLRTRAEGVRLAIAETAQRTSLRWSFRVSRGSPVPTMLTESLEADLLLIGSERSVPTPALGTIHRAPIMIVNNGVSNSRVLDTAQRLARTCGDSIVALVISEPSEARELSADAPLVSYIQRCSADKDALLQAVRQWQPQLLLIDRSSELISEATITSLATQLPCPLVLVQ